MVIICGNDQVSGQHSTHVRDDIETDMFNNVTPWVGTQHWHPFCLPWLAIYSSLPFS